MSSLTSNADTSGQEVNWGEKKTCIGVDLSTHQYKFLKNVVFDNDVRTVEVVRATLALLEKKLELLEHLRGELA